jgi:hypothetical protein
MSNRIERILNMSNPWYGWQRKYLKPYGSCYKAYKKSFNYDTPQEAWEHWTSIQDMTYVLHILEADNYKLALFCFHVFLDVFPEWDKTSSGKDIRKMLDLIKKYSDDRERDLELNYWKEQRRLLDKFSHLTDDDFQEPDKNMKNMLEAIESFACYLWNPQFRQSGLTEVYPKIPNKYDTLKKRYYYFERYSTRQCRILRGFFPDITVYLDNVPPKKVYEQSVKYVCSSNSNKPTGYDNKSLTSLNSCYTYIPEQCGDSKDFVLVADFDPYAVHDIKLSLQCCRDLVSSDIERFLEREEKRREVNISNKEEIIKDIDNDYKLRLIQKVCQLLF